MRDHETNRRLSVKEPVTVDVWQQSMLSMPVGSCPTGRTSGQLPARRISRRQNPNGSQARRSADGAADEIRVRDQSETAKQIGLTIRPTVLAQGDQLMK